MGKKRNPLKHEACLFVDWLFFCGRRHRAFLLWGGPEAKGRTGGPSMWRVPDPQPLPQGPSDVHQRLSVAGEDSQPQASPELAKPPSSDHSLGVCGWTEGGPWEGGQWRFGVQVRTCHGRSRCPRTFGPTGREPDSGGRAK